MVFQFQINVRRGTDERDATPQSRSTSSNIQNQHYMATHHILTTSFCLVTSEGLGPLAYSSVRVGMCNTLSSLWYGSITQ